jgi:hypothetical protein
MKKSLAFLTVLLGSFCSLAQVGTMFPHLSAQKLDDKTVELPLHTKGKHTLLALAYSQEAEKDLATWYQPVYETFIHKDKGGVFQTESYDIHLFIVPMFTGANQAAHAKAVQQMKENVDQHLWNYVLVYKGDIKPYKESLGLSKKEIPYLFVLDKTGKVVYMTSGKYTDEKLEEIEHHVGSSH